MALDSTRRLWGRLGVPASLAVLALSAALVVRQTHGSVLAEIYALLSAPFRPEIDLDVALSSAANRELQAQVDELEFQNRLLRELLDIQRQVGDDGMAAEVIGRSVDRWWHHLTLSKGTRQGIGVGDVVMAPGGLVGRVDAVSPNTSRILLISDPSSQIGVTFGDSRARGIMRGLGSQRAVIETLERSPDIQVGETVLSSGLSSLYPGGIPIGRVESYDLRATPAPEVIVELSAPLDRLEWALVYSFQTANEVPIAPNLETDLLEDPPSESDLPETDSPSP
ncbi:MAG: rod shape-determining protein MreC [Cyanobacteria bacterium J06597_1]